MQIFSFLPDSGFVVLQGTTYWTDLFVRHFLFQAEHAIDGDDLLFFVRKKHVKTSSRYLPKFETEVDVFRKDSKKLPIGDPDIDWEETVYLNLVVHQFDYTLTLAICTRTSPKELQVRIDSAIDDRRNIQSSSNGLYFLSTFQSIFFFSRIWYNAIYFL